MNPHKEMPYGNDTGLRIVVSLLSPNYYHFKATCEVNQDADVWWTGEKTDSSCVECVNTTQIQLN
jgi:hypothetical protein